MQKVNLVEKLALFKDHWSPKIIGELNGQQVKRSSSRANSPGTNTTRSSSIRRPDGRHRVPDPEAPWP